MTYRALYDEGRIAKLLGALPPAPPSWVEAAQELPRASEAMDGMVARVEADQRFESEVFADLEKLELAEPRPDEARQIVNGNGAEPGGAK